MSQFFISLYNFFTKHRIVFIIFIAFTSIVIGYFASRIKFEEEITISIPKDNKSDKFSFALQNIKFLDKLIVTVSLSDTVAEPSPDKLISFIDEFVEYLKKDYNKYIKEITYKVYEDSVQDVINIFYNNLPVFLDENDYIKIDSLISENRINSAIKNDFKTLVSPASIVLKKFIKRDPIGISYLVLDKLKSFQFDENYEMNNGYIFTKDRKKLILFITPANPPSETSENTKLIKGIERTIEKISVQYNNSVKAEYFGAAAVAVGNAEQIKKDVVLTVTISIVIILVFVAWFFRKVSISFISFLPAIFGGGLALAIIFLVKSKVSIIALGIGSALLGIIVDYALYIFSVYRTKGSVEKVLKDMSITITLCSLTTATAFFSLLFVKSAVLNDLGLFAGISILGAALFSLLILPHLLKLKNKVGDNNKRITFIDKISNYKFESNIYLVLFIILISIVFLFTSKRVQFETDMNTMNFSSKKLKEAEINLNRINKVSLKSVYLVSTGKDLNHALANNAKISEVLKDLKNKNIVKKYSDAGSILISDSIQKIRIEKWKKYWTKNKKEKFKEWIIAAGAQYKFKKDAFSEFYNFLDRDFKPVEISSFDKIRKLFLNDRITETKDLTMIVSLLRVENKDREKVYSTFSGNKNVVIIDKQSITSKFVENIKTDFNLMVYLCLIFVSLVLIVSYGRIEIGLIASLPMFASWLWTIGIMGIFGLKFNIFNIIISTFIFGLGVDYSILMMRGLLLEYKNGQKELSSYKTAVFLSAFTTIIGVGVMIFAKHPSLKSIALLSIIGMLSIVIVTYTITPILFKWLIYKGKKKRTAPITFCTLLYSVVVFILFLLGYVVIMIFMILSMYNKKGKLVFHKVLTKASKFIVYIMINVKKIIINKHSEDFKKPAVIICNHQSFIDVLLIRMLYPKLIVLSYDKIWNSLICGVLIRFADFYPVSRGIEKSLDMLAEKVKVGYSILIFSEGTRSETTKIKHFRKGAFYIAEKLNLDILPIIIHGSGDCITKGEPFLKSGRIVLKILERIKPDDNSFGLNYIERTPSIQKYFNDEFNNVKKEFDTAHYYRKKLIKNYIYKGPMLEWYLRVKMRSENNYEIFNEYIPQEGRIVDLGCGYGFTSYMLSYLSEKRNILGIDYDCDKITVASNCISKNEKINFVCSDILEYPFILSDAFILNDILHFLPEEKQEQLIIKCIDNLNENGIIFIREGNTDLKKHHTFTLLAKYFSTYFESNKSYNKELFLTSGNKMIEISSKYDINIEIIDKHMSDIIYIIRKKPTDEILGTAKN